LTGFGFGFAFLFGFGCGVGVGVGSGLGGSGLGGSGVGSGCCLALQFLACEYFNDLLDIDLLQSGHAAFSSVSFFSALRLFTSDFRNCSISSVSISSFSVWGSALVDGGSAGCSGCIGSDGCGARSATCSGCASGGVIGMIVSFLGIVVYIFKYYIFFLLNILRIAMESLFN
jgi:hypothetical protein